MLANGAVTTKRRMTLHSRGCLTICLFGKQPVGVFQCGTCAGRLEFSTAVGKMLRTKITKDISWIEGCWSYCERISCVTFRNSLRLLCVLCVSAVSRTSNLSPQRRRERRESAERILIIALVFSFNITPLQSQHKPMPEQPNYQKLAAEMEQTLDRHVLAVWFPRSVDKDAGGFYSNFTRDWQRTTSEGKFSVFQGRMVWVAAQVMMQRPQLAQDYKPIVIHGFHYLNDVLWDKEDGGFFWGLDDKNKTSSRFTDGKHLYGVSFGLYGATAAYEATRDPEALELAKKTFRWIDQHGHDSTNGGYHEWLTRDGKIVEAKGGPTLEGVPVAGFPLGTPSNV